MLISVNIGNGPTAFVIATIILSFLTMMFFAIIMKRPTIRGRELLDEMLGFKDFLEIAEKDELNLRNPPTKTPELFEMMLPYALALGVEQQWSERFADVLAAIRGPDGEGYSPSWYNGTMEHIESVQDDQGPVERSEFRRKFVRIATRLFVRWWWWRIVRWWWRRWRRRRLVMAATRIRNV